MLAYNKKGKTSIGVNKKIFRLLQEAPNYRYIFVVEDEEIADIVE